MGQGGGFDGRGQGLRWERGRGQAALPAALACDLLTKTPSPERFTWPSLILPNSQVYKGGRLLALADEEGYLTIIDTTLPLPSNTFAEDGGPRPAAQWLAHRNAIFDLAWFRVRRQRGYGSAHDSESEPRGGGA